VKVCPILIDFLMRYKLLFMQVLLIKMWTHKSLLLVKVHIK